MRLDEEGNYGVHLNNMEEVLTHPCFLHGLSTFNTKCVVLVSLPLPKLCLTQSGTHCILLWSVSL